MNTERTLMTNLYRSVFHFAECLRCADYACATKAEIRFVMRIQYRYIHKDQRMKMTMLEHQRLLALTIKGGWDGSAIVEAENVLCA